MGLSKRLTRREYDKQMQLKEMLSRLDAVAKRKAPANAVIRRRKNNSGEREEHVRKLDENESK